MMSRPNYSGRWRFNAEASTLQIAIPSALDFTIEHREPFFRLERTLRFGDRTDTFSIDLTVGAEPVPVPRGDATIYPGLQWDVGVGGGDQLVFRTRIVRGGEEAINLVRYRLEPGGNTLVADESFRSSSQNYDNRWVLTRERGPQ